MKTLTFLLLFLQIINTGGSRKVFTPVTCLGLPSYSAQFKASTTTAGAVGTWNDSSGNSNTASFSAGPSNPASGTSQPTPNGGETVVFTNVAGQRGTLTNTISTSTAVAICAVYKLTGIVGVFNQLEGNTTAGAAGYFAGGNGLTTQQLNTSTSVFDGTATVSAGVWYDTCVSYTVGGAWTFYRNGSTDGSGTSSATFTQPISFAFGLSTYVIAELDIMNTAITSTQATAIHNCAVSTYGVP